ncbi:hypothetical protein MHU86_419 [Fragilaria crotonensis]|nr:hypothetical protein MHU86_419 [Fragilaria crotonensis]
MVLTAAGSGLPPVLASAIPSIRWHLGALSSPPLHYESLESLKALRESPGLALLHDLPSAIDSLFTSSDADKRHFGIVATALILIGNGFTDECHNIITPLSWPDDIHFAHGPSVYADVSAEARAYASYVHCLVHRREAFNVGEFGMMGFANANYWSRAVSKSSGVNLLPYERLVSEVRALAALSSVEAQDWVTLHVPDDLFLESRAVHELCANVLREATPLREFAERVAETEVRVLLAHALQKAGYDVSFDCIVRRDEAVPLVSSLKANSDRVPTSHIDESIALTAAKKVSSAHFDNFQATGYIVLRQVLQGDDVISATAGVACRLFASPACRWVTPSEYLEGTQHELLFITVSQDAAKNLLVERGSVVSLSPGDLLATVSPGKAQHEGLWFAFAPCEPSESATFVDRLYGTRGPTPTTVVQWSKGTIF